MPPERRRAAGVRDHRSGATARSAAPRRGCHPNSSETARRGVEAGRTRPGGPHRPVEATAPRTHAQQPEDEQPVLVVDQREERRGARRRRRAGRRPDELVLRDARTAARIRHRTELSSKSRGSPADRSCEPARRSRATARRSAVGVQGARCAGSVSAAPPAAAEHVVVEEEHGGASASRGEQRARGCACGPTSLSRSPSPPATPTPRRPGRRGSRQAVDRERRRGRRRAASVSERGTCTSPTAAISFGRARVGSAPRAASTRTTTRGPAVAAEFERAERMPGLGLACRSRGRHDDHGRARPRPRPVLGPGWTGRAGAGAAAPGRRVPSPSRPEHLPAHESGGARPATPSGRLSSADRRSTGPASGVELDQSGRTRRRWNGRVRSGVRVWAPVDRREHRDVQEHPEVARPRTARGGTARCGPRSVGSVRARTVPYVPRLKMPLQMVRVAPWLNGFVGPGEQGDVVLEPRLPLRRAAARRPGARSAGVLSRARHPRG